MSRANTSRSLGPSSKAWIGLESLIRLADAADIPFCGGAFSIAAEVIGAFNVSISPYHICGRLPLAKHIGPQAINEVRPGYTRLVEAVSAHSDTLWEFVESMSPEYLKNSEETPAVLGRKAIEDFKMYDHSFLPRRGLIPKYSLSANLIGLTKPYREDYWRADGPSPYCRAL